MSPRIFARLTILSLLAAFAGVASAEVYVVLDSGGRVSDVRVESLADPSAPRIWEPSGRAASSSLVLNPNGDLLADGAPEIALHPTTRLPRAVWTRRARGTTDIVTSSFNGRSWSEPIRIHQSNSDNDVSPKITYTHRGVAVVVWSAQGTTPGIRLAYATGPRTWIDLGIISAPEEKGREPAILQVGSSTVIAYQSSTGVKLRSINSGHNSFGDGPTPFPISPPPEPSRPPAEQRP